MLTLARRGSFYGGVFLPQAKNTTERAAISALPPAPILRIPVPNQAVVVPQPAQTIPASECLARQPCGSRIDSPVIGRFRRIVRVDTDMAIDVPAMEIDVLELPEALPPSSEHLLRNYQDIDDADMITALQNCRAVQPDPRLSCSPGDVLAIKDHEPHTLIINSMESEPCLTAEYRLLKEHHGLLCRAVQCLHRLLRCRRTCWVIDRARGRLLRRVGGTARRTPIRVLGLHNRFPIGTVPLLVQATLGREIPRGQRVTDSGVLVLSTDVLFHIARALAGSGAPVGRVVTVCGDVIQRPGNYWVPVGTPVAHVLQAASCSGHPQRCILGGPMTGRAVDWRRAVVTLSCPAVLALGMAESLPPPMACVQCGWCLEVCPMRLDPAALIEAIELQRHDSIARLHADACISCGLCSYVCPSSLPLTSTITAARDRA